MPTQMQVTLIKLSKFISSPEILKANQMLISYFPYITRYMRRSAAGKRLILISSPLQKGALFYTTSGKLQVVNTLSFALLRVFHVCFTPIV